MKKTPEEILSDIQARITWLREAAKRVLARAIRLENEADGLVKDEAPPKTPPPE